MWPYENDAYPDGYFTDETADHSKPEGKKPEYGHRHGSRHGVAVIHYVSGKLFAADNVRLADGSAGTKSTIIPEAAPEGP
jgi:hypothetical protein